MELVGTSDSGVGVNGSSKTGIGVAGTAGTVGSDGFYDRDHNLLTFMRRNIRQLLL